MRKWIDLGAQLILGLIFFVFGLNKFLHFMAPPELPADAGAFMGALVDSGYFFSMLAVVEIVGGALLLVRRFVPLALLLLAPVVVNILAFHLALAPSGLPIAVVLVALEGYLGFVVHRDSFRHVLAATPEDGSPTG